MNFTIGMFGMFIVGLLLLLGGVETGFRGMVLLGLLTVVVSTLAEIIWGSWMLRR